MQRLIAIIGAGECSEQDYEVARSIGALLAQNGFGVVCGGRTGVMEAAMRGAKEANGASVAILPQGDFSDVSEYADIVIPSGFGIGRNILIVRSALAIIAVGGKYGTLSEIAFALQLNKPVIALGSWQVSEDIVQVSSPEEAVDMIKKSV
jgi:uncharacterized protein (TIGR00725 family)